MKAALELVGVRAGTLRLPLVECDEAELAIVRSALEAHGLVGDARRAGSGQAVA